MLSAHAHFRIGFRLPASRGSGRKSVGPTEFYVPGPPGAGLLAFPGGSSASSPLTSGPVGARPSLAQRSVRRPAGPLPAEARTSFLPQRIWPNSLPHPVSLFAVFCFPGWSSWRVLRPAASTARKLSVLLLTSFQPPPGPCSPSAPSRVLVSISSLWCRFETVRDRVRLGSLRPPRVNGLLDRAGR